ncbi:MCE family protein [Mycolicibacterium pulveris]|uniref:MCE-family protein MCE3A n=1 Tax=Mycolicibacterium pulveris TaxID=36813 RepID=A0A7I7UIE3_MYCPV|nr:MCE family protein [Mycolicibacterium pulveris]MCV6978872.1 MCE family protein [Mycolicibacterium pulveris]BBY79926.1 MCE-family protein MCE3A [Mycolicibacterium pulveris]
MNRRAGTHRISTGWWTLILLAVIVVFLFGSAAAFRGTFRSYVGVTLTSERAGLVMETDADVMLRGVRVGRVSRLSNDENGTSLKLELDPDQVRYIPANVTAQISATTAFGTKFVELVYPSEPSPARLTAGAVLYADRVSTEVNTVFENVVDLLNMIDPLKLNAVLTAVAEGVRGQGERMGQSITDLNQVLLALNERSETIGANWRSLKNFTDTYDAAAEDIVAILDAVSTTSTTVTEHERALDALLLNVVGFTEAGTNLLATSKDDFVDAVNTLQPTTGLLLHHNPVYTCFLQGATWYLENGGYAAWGGDGRTLQLDVALLLGNDPYTYPEHLPIVAAKGGPGGQPGCGSLPDATKNFPVRQLITNTGWGTGLDIRPNPGIGHPCWANYLPVTRAVPEPPSIRQCIPGPAIGPITAPGAPPYGAPWYGPDGTPLWPGVPPPKPSPTPMGANQP